MRLTFTQSVLEIFEEDSLFVFRGFTEGDNSDFIFALCVNYGNNNDVQNAECDKALLRIFETVVFISKCQAFKHFLCVYKVQRVNL